MTEVLQRALPSVPVIEFLGATGTVTGSRFLVETPRSRVLVDCGLFQGLKELRRRNWKAFPRDPASIDAVVLTHAHVDHCGYLPALVRQGFRGRVFATEDTVGLCGIVLPDAAHIQEEEAAYANRKGFSKHEPALPLYTAADAAAALDCLVPVPFGQATEVSDGVRALFTPAGHILGSAIVTLEAADCGTRITFSGDLGRPAHPLLTAPSAPPESDVVVVESTYGDREHAEDDVVERLAEAVSRIASRGGVTVIPAFAVDRTEIVLLHLKRLMDEGRLDRIPVFVDSPMALSALRLYRRAIAEAALDLRPELRGMPEPFDTGTLVEAQSVDASKAIHGQRGPAIVISASGMAAGGRVLHHLAERLPEPRNGVLMVGFQPLGTRGRRLLDGERSIKMLGRYVPVRAEVIDLSAFSVHADRSELLAWLRSAPREPDSVHVVHGEPAAAEALRSAIESELGWCAAAPGYRERVRIDQRPG